MTSPKPRSYGKYLPGLFSLSDLVLVNLLFVVTLWLCPEIRLGDHLRTVWVLINTAYIPIIMTTRSQRHQMRVVLMEQVVYNALRFVGIHALFFLALLSFLEIDIPLRGYLTFYLLMFVCVPSWWMVSRRILKKMRRRGYNFLRVVVVGTGPTAVRLLQELRSDAGFGYKIVSIFSDDPAPDFPEPVTGTIADLAEYVKVNRVDQIFHTLSGEDEESLSTVIRIADNNMLQFYFVPQISRRVARGFELFQIGTMPVMSIRRNPLNSVVNRAIKRTFDIVFSSVVLLFSPIVFIPVAIAIKVSSPGPIFFKQERTGYKGRTFLCLKFRTMRVNNTADTAQATADDPRKTRVGEFLRHTSIDELPQFWNVLRGEMSIVGPRPHMLKHTEDYTKLIDRYMVRHVVKPGITGWAQVSGYRGITDRLWKMERRVEHDVWYIENWSFLLDLRIIVRTVINAIAGEKNAF